MLVLVMMMEKIYGSQSFVFYLVLSARVRHDLRPFRSSHVSFNYIFRNPTSLWFAVRLRKRQPAIVYGKGVPVETVLSIVEI